MDLEFNTAFKYTHQIANQTTLPYEINAFYKSMKICE